MLEDVLFELYVEECVEYSRTLQIGKNVFLVTTRSGLPKYLHLNPPNL